MKWAETPNKPPVKVSEPQKPQQLFDSGGHWPICDGGHLALIHGDALKVDNIS